MNYDYVMNIKYVMCALK